MADQYLTALRVDHDATAAYYRKSIVKTEQQKLLERLLCERGTSGLSSIADVACGGGTLTHHLSHLIPSARFVLLDYNRDAIATAQEVNGDDPRYQYVQGNLNGMPWADGQFDAVCCSQTLSWIDEPEAALKEMIRSVKRGGRVYVSSLFNLTHDVDLYTKVIDHTRRSGELGMGLSYNTFSRLTIERWLANRVTNLEFVPFHPEIDFEYTGRGIGTYTVKCGARRLQVSAGLLLNWAFLIATR